MSRAIFIYWSAGKSSLSGIFAAFLIAFICSSKRVFNFAEFETAVSSNCSFKFGRERK